MTKRIAIVGAGTAGLHLGLYLQQQGGQSTIFTDKKIEDYPSVRLLNTVAHHAVTGRTPSEPARARDGCPWRRRIVHRHADPIAQQRAPESLLW